MQIQSIATSNNRFSNPFDWYAEMRQKSPVYYDAEQQSWMVFRYNDVKTVFANTNFLK